MKRLARWFAARPGPWLIARLAATWRVEVVNRQHWAAVLDSGKPYVLLSWHEALLPVMWHHRRLGIAAMVSEARDGQYLAQLARKLGYRVIGGSSSRGGHRAVRAGIRALRSGIPIGVTPDGPRGPRRVAKLGVIVAAEWADALIVPVHAEARPAWRARSWDRFLLPLPFARVRLAYGTPFVVPAAEGGRAAAAGRMGNELHHAMRLAAWSNAAAMHIA